MLPFFSSFSPQNFATPLINNIENLKAKKELGISRNNLLIYQVVFENFYFLHWSVSFYHGKGFYTYLSELNVTLKISRKIIKELIRSVRLFGGSLLLCFCFLGTIIKQLGLIKISLID